MAPISSGAQRTSTKFSSAWYPVLAHDVGDKMAARTGENKKFSRKKDGSGVVTNAQMGDKWGKVYPT